jgi:hypothetical protein
MTLLNCLRRGRVGSRGVAPASQARAAAKPAARPRWSPASLGAQLSSVPCHGPPPSQGDPAARLVSGSALLSRLASAEKALDGDSPDPCRPYNGGR